MLDYTKARNLEFFKNGKPKANKNLKFITNDSKWFYKTFLR